MSSPKTLLVTTGATAPFPALLSAVLNTHFLALLARSNFHNLRIQHGSGLGASTFHSLKESSASHILRVSGFEFTDDMAAELAKADVVVTHAGSGSVLEALRAGKRVVAVVNGELMGNHQKELADELERCGYLLGATPENLAQVFPKVLEKEFKHMPQQQGQALGEVLAEEVGIQFEQEG